MLRRDHYKQICQHLCLRTMKHPWELTTRNDDDEQQHNYAHDDPDPHLHVLPPHLLADSVGATAEALGGLVEVLGFILELVDVLAALSDGFEVLFHDVDGVVDLLLMERGVVSDCALLGRRADDACRQVRSWVHGGGGCVMKAEHCRGWHSYCC